MTSLSSLEYSSEIDLSNSSFLFSYRMCRFLSKPVELIIMTNIIAQWLYFLLNGFWYGSLLNFNILVVAKLNDFFILPAELMWVYAVRYKHKDKCYKLRFSEKRNDCNFRRLRCDISRQLRYEKITFNEFGDRNTCNGLTHR